MQTPSKISRPALLLGSFAFLMGALTIAAPQADARRSRNIPSPTPTASPTPTPTPSPSPTPILTTDNPFAAASFYIDPSSNAAKQASSWRLTRPADALQMDKIAANPQADWFSGWSGDITAAVRTRTQTIASAGALPVLVAYNIPQRDCGGYSAGGVGSPEAYRTWITNFAAGISSNRSVVILEPDALAGMGCLTTTDQQTRLDLLDYAVTTLNTKAGVSVYLDGGHSRWQSAAEMAKRLNGAGVAKARGFSLNVSNFNATSNELAYGDSIAGLVGGKKFIVDTSRNGLGPTLDFQWCNPAGRALGERASASTSRPNADAYFWIKGPGESDGSCNGGPSAGSWWAEYALGLAERAVY